MKAGGKDLLNPIETKILELQRARHSRRVWFRVLSILACITVFFTTYALILPAITMEAETICGKVSHSHSTECYDAEGNLICLLEEHEHDLLCFAQTKVTEPDFLCGYYYEHEHNDDCYLPNGCIICTLIEHEHTDECLPEPVSDVKRMTDSEDEIVEEDIIPSRAKSVPTLMASAGDFSSCDLAEFLTYVELTDIDGNVIDLNDSESVVNVGERYKLFLHFDEDPDTNHLKQFEYDDNGYLVYDLDAIGLKFESAHSVGGDITILYEGYQKVVGHYIFELDNDIGKHLVKVWFDDVDDSGESTPGINFIDQVQDAGFGLEFSVYVDADGDDDELNIDLGASWNVTLKKDDDVCLTVNKVTDSNDVPFEDRYPKYDAGTRSLLYKVVVKCTKGAVDNLSYSDRGIIKVLDVEYELSDPGYSNYSDFVITDLNGNPIATGDSFDCLTAASGPISKGDGYIIYYRMKIEPPGKDDIINRAATLYAIVDNTISVDYQNPSDRTEECNPVESSTSTRVGVTNLAKRGAFNGDRDASDHKIIGWSIIAGEGHVPLTTPLTVTDTLGAGHSFYAGNPPTWELLDSDGNVRDSGTFSPSDFSEAGNILTFSLPHGTDYPARFKVNYSTVTNNDDGGTYSNTAEVQGKDWTVTSSVNVAGGRGSMTKAVTDSDSEYIYYTITANIPHSSSPFVFYFTDTFYADDRATNIENAAENFTVQVEYFDEANEKQIYVMPQYNAVDDEISYYIKRNDGQNAASLSQWQMYFFKGSADNMHYSNSKWYFNDYDSVLTVSYRIPKSSKVFLSNGNTSSIRDHIAGGKTITNQVWLDSTYNATVNYTEPLPVTKRGRPQSFSDGTFLYEVAFTNDVIPLGETNPANYISACEHFMNTVFTDDFDDKLEYVPNSLMALVYRRSGNTRYSYIGNNFGIYDANPNQSPDIEAVFRYIGADPSGSYINATWNNFIYEDHSTNGQEYIFGHLVRSWTLNRNVHENMTLEEFANSLKKTNGENDTAVVFLYQLKMKDEYKLSTDLSLHNETQIKWDMPDSGTYVTPPAVFDIQYDSSLVKKEMNYQGGDVVSYEIIINPHGMDLTSDATMIVQDTMCEFLSPYMATLKVYQGTPDALAPIWGSEIEPNAIYNPETNIITMTLPDDVPLRITYNCLILNAEEGESVSLDNSVAINGTPNSVSVNTANVLITASSSTGMGTNHYMYLQKQDNDNHPLNGAVFALYGNKESNRGIAPHGVAQEITYNGVTLYYYSSHTTQDDSKNVYLHGVIRLDETNDKLEKKGLFALVEVEPPSGFDVDPNPLYFYWMDTPDDAVEGADVFTHERDYAFVDNPLSYTLPETGSSGGLICMCLVASCFTVAAVLAFMKIRRKLYGKKE